MSKYLDRTVDEVLAWSRSEIRNPTRDWRGMCQSHCRSAYGVQGWSPSAITAWHKIPDAKRNEGGSPEEAPRGAVLYYSGGQFGHAALAAGVRRTASACPTTTCATVGSTTLPVTSPAGGTSTTSDGRRGLRSDRSA